MFAEAPELLAKCEHTVIHIRGPFTPAFYHMKRLRPNLDFKPQNLQLENA